MSIPSHLLYVPLLPPNSRQARPVGEIISAASEFERSGRHSAPIGRLSGHDLHGYITEQQTVDPLRPVPWADIMETCGFSKDSAASPFRNIAVARKESTVPIVDMACYPSHSLAVIKRGNPETPLSGFQENNHFRDVLMEAINAGELTNLRTETLHFLFIRPEPESELSQRIRT